MGADAIAPQPAGVGQFERARQPAVIGQQQQALGVEIEPADRDQPRQAFRQIVEHRRPPFGVGMGGHQAARLVIHEQPRALARRQRLAVDGDDVVGGDVERRRIDDAAVDGDAALHDPFLGIAARGEAGARHHLGDALAGFLFARRPRRRACRIQACARDRRRGRRTPDVLQRSCCRPRCRGAADRRPSLAARMLLPGAAAFARTIEFRTTVARRRTIELRPLTKRTIALRTILARARKSRTLIAAAVVARLVETRLVEIARAVAGGTRIATGMVGRDARASATALTRRDRRGRSPKSLRGPRSGAPRENFLSPPNFRSGRSPRGRSPSRDGRAL